MKGWEAAHHLRRLADVVEQFEHIPKLKQEAWPEEVQVGAAAMLIFLRDSFTISSKTSFTREDILVMLNLLQSDKDIFTVDLVTLMDEAINEDT